MRPDIVDHKASFFVLIAQAQALPNREEDLKAALLALATQSANDDGCLKYDVYIDDEDPKNFTLFENWASRDLWEAHMESQHVRDFITLSEKLVADWNFQNLNRLHSVT